MVGQNAFPRFQNLTKVPSNGNHFPVELTDSNRRGEAIGSYVVHSKLNFVFDGVPSLVSNNRTQKNTKVFPFGLNPEVDPSRGAANQQLTKLFFICLIEFTINGDPGDLVTLVALVTLVTLVTPCDPVHPWWPL